MIPNTPNYSSEQPFNYAVRNRFLQDAISELPIKLILNWPHICSSNIICRGKPKNPAPGQS